MTPSRPSVDLLVPAFNAARFLPRLRAQVDALDPAFFSVQLQDDCSTDETSNAAEALGFSVSRSATNQGPGGARNRLAARSSSEWIHFHDVDDEIAPDYLAQVSPHLTNDVDLLIHNVDFVDELTRAPVISFNAQVDLDTDPVRSLLVHPMGGTSSVIRRELFLKIGGFDEMHRCFEDGDLHLRLALAGARVRRLPKSLTTSLRHDTGASADMGYCHRCRLAFLKRYVDLVPPRLIDDLAGEALKTAHGLLQHRDRVRAQQSVDLCKRLGGTFPRTANPVFRAMAALLPDLTVIELQEGFRRCMGRLPHSLRQAKKA